MRRQVFAGLLIPFMLLELACDNGPSQPDLTPIELSITNLTPLDPETEGTYETWVVSPGGDLLSAGRFIVTSDPTSVETNSPVPNPEDIMITVEPPDDDDDRPSMHKLFGGRFTDGIATLTTVGYVTVVGVPLEPTPGTHILASPSDDGENGYPSHEDAGLWLFNIGGDTLDGSYYLDFSPLTEGWYYEGWIVRDYGSVDAIWISYGKFRPDAFRQSNDRDDTGLGFFSGRTDYEFALSLTVRTPGDDWLGNALGLDVPGGVQLPLDLNGDADLGILSRWTHVITIEPWGPNRAAESIHDAKPFWLEPYRNAIGEAPASTPRDIVFHPEGLPTGTATLRRD